MVVKFFQLLAVTEDCGTMEALSVLFFLGGLDLMYIFFLLRYIEVYMMTWRVFPIALAIAVFTASIPISILTNRTVASAGTCQVDHSLVSAWLPAGASITISVLTVILFLEPIIATTSGVFSQDTKVRRAGYLVFVAFTAAAAFTVFFHVSLSTSLEQFAPMLSSLDSMVVLVCTTVPYFYVRFLSLQKMIDTEGTIDI